MTEQTQNNVLDAIAIARRAEAVHLEAVRRYELAEGTEGEPEADEILSEAAGALTQAEDLVIKTEPRTAAEAAAVLLFVADLLASGLPVCGRQDELAEVLRRIAPFVATVH